VVLAAAGIAVAHHAAQGIVDEDINAMIDDLVADTPHGDMELSDLDGGMTEILITQVTVREIESMIADGLLSYGGVLDGEVGATISFATMRNVEVTILRAE
jgi:hypothetical protein